MPDFGEFCLVIVGEGVCIVELLEKIFDAFSNIFELIPEETKNEIKEDLGAVILEIWDYIFKDNPYFLKIIAFLIILTSAFYAFIRPLFYFFEKTSIGKRIISTFKTDSLYKYIQDNELLELSNYNNFLDFRFSGIGFHGRDTEMSNINTFMTRKSGENKKRRLSILTITGKGGNGKSRLAFHTALLYSDFLYLLKQYKKKTCSCSAFLRIWLKRKWKVLWIDDNSIDDVENLEITKIPKRLLVICDYASNYADQFNSIVSKLKNNLKRSYIRVIILDRALDQMEINRQYHRFKPIILDNTINKNASNKILEELTKEKTCVLVNEKLQENSWFKRKLKYKKIKEEIGKRLLLDAGKKEKIYIDTIEDNKGLFFLLLHGDAVLENKYKGDTGLLKYDSNAVIKNLIIRIERKWLKSITDTDVKMSALKLVALATVIGNFSFNNQYNDYRDEYLKCIQNYCSNNNTKLRNLFKKINPDDSKNLSNNVLPLTPDLLGECFVVYHYNNLHNTEKENWLKIFMNESQSKKYAQFMRHLYQDWYHIDESKQFVADCVKHISENRDDYSKAASNLSSIIYHAAKCMNNNSMYYDSIIKLETMYKAYRNQVKPHLIKLYEQAINYYTNDNNVHWANEIRDKLNQLENDILTAKKEEPNHDSYYKNNTHLQSL